MEIQHDKVEYFAMIVNHKDLSRCQKVHFDYFTPHLDRLLQQFVSELQSVASGRVTIILSRLELTGITK